jgi:hypothetical protein
MKANLLLGMAVTALLVGCSTYSGSSGSSSMSPNADSRGQGHYGSYGRVSESPGPGTTASPGSNGSLGSPR